SIKNSDLAASYYYLKQRVNLAGGIFHYRNLLNSNFTSLGEIYDQTRTFSERNYGVFGLASYPFTTFTRLDFELQAFISEKTFYDFDPFVGLYFETGRQSDRVVQPSLSYVHDSTLYGRWGPVTGTRYAISFSPTLGLSDEDVDRATSFVDYRRYFQMWDRNTFVFRFVGAQSVGKTPRNFVIGGPWTLRGWDVYDFERVGLDGAPLYPNLLGQKMLLMNLEYRFPALDAIIFGWPGRWGIGGIEGAAYFDVGTAFDDEVQFFGSTPSGAFKLQDLNADFGFGIRVALGFLPLKFDWAWKTDFARTARTPQFNFSSGPQF
ncbi:MAG: BamA/TamA family outer membrane protein, partial [Deltaproteobacteria bacterium]|nr:BamA/TamA family outer membrane protein [Deltaproteobacteria bacterium]